MRNAILLAGMWVGIIVFAYGVVYWDLGPTENPYLPDVPFTETIYTDPGGTFQVTIPAGWIVNGEDPYVMLEGPQREIRGGIVTIVEEDPEAALAAAWSVIDSSAAPQPEILTAGSALDSSAPAWHLTYTLPEDRTAVAAAYQESGAFTVMILYGLNEAMVRRGSDIDRIQIVTFDVPEPVIGPTAQEPEGADEPQPSEEEAIPASDETEPPASGETEPVIPEEIGEPGLIEVQTPSETP